MAYEKKDRSLWLNRGRRGFDSSGGVVCKECFQKKLIIDDLRVENQRLKEKIKRLEEPRREVLAGNCGGRISKKEIEGALHHPKRMPPLNVKKNSTAEDRAKRGGAKKGHKGNGRVAGNADTVIPVDGSSDACPDCGERLQRLESRDRTVVEAMPFKAKRSLYRCRRYRCNKCRKVIQTQPEVLPRALYGNRLLSQAAVMHYVHGVSIGRLLEIFGSEVTEGGIIQALHRLGGECEKMLPHAVTHFRNSHVRHADETPWRTDGHSGYAWLFSTKDSSILEFTNTRSARVPRRIFGESPLTGFLVVDRYGAYNKLPVQLQYCFAHFLRDVEKLEYDFPEDSQVLNFTSRIIPPITAAMKLRGLGLPEDEYYRKAHDIKKEIKDALQAPYKHLAIRRVQQVFLEKEHRLFHWVDDLRVPAENNFAERELRPTVIARKVSFGSQSDAGAKTRGAIMSVLWTAKKRLKEKEPVEDWLRVSLNQISRNPQLNIFDLLPPALPD
jgi:transposase